VEQLLVHTYEKKDSDMTTKRSFTFRGGKKKS